MSFSSSHPKQISIHPETLRLTAYMLFWAMVLLAGILTKFFVTENLDASPFVQVVGYNNICIFWDYEPARSITAMFYPFVEVALVGYIFLNFFQIYISYQQGLIPKKLYRLVCLLLPIELILVLWFRMIFMHKLSDSILIHSLGFYGLIVALALISIQNVLYLHTIRSLLFPLRMTVIYISTVLIVSISKIIFTFLFFTGIAVWDGHSQWVPILGHSLDIIWMFLVAVIPIMFAYLGRKKIHPIALRYGS
jgi:hypothetical protein